MGVCGGRSGAWAALALAGALVAGAQGDDDVPTLQVGHAVRPAADAGLLAVLGSEVRKKEGVAVRWREIDPNATTGEADDDVVLRHARPAEPVPSEARLVWVERLVVVGPPKARASYGEFNYESEMSPRGVTGGWRPVHEAKAAVLLANLSAADVRFVSRGDRSFVHSVELELWVPAGPPVAPKYVPANADMETTLTKTNEWAGEGPAYTLADEVTYLRSKHRANLEVVLAADPKLEFFVVARPTGRHAALAEAVSKFLAWLASDEAQRRIREFAVAGEHPFSAPGADRTWSLRGRLDPKPPPKDDPDDEK